MLGATITVLVAILPLFAEVMTSKELEGWFTLIVAALIAFAILRKKRFRFRGSEHGTASFATEAELKRAGLFGAAGLILGRTLGKAAKLIRHADFCHLAIFASTGAGKGVSCLIVWMLSRWKGARIIFDPKGEVLEKVQATCRQMKRKLWVLAPFSGGAHSFNPLDLVPFGRECIDYCRAISEAMVPRTQEEKDPHFNDRAVDVIAAVLVYICVNFRGPERSLSSLREIVTSSGLFTGCAKGLIEMGGVYARLGGSMLSLQDKELASVLSTVSRHTCWLDSEPILEATKSGIDAPQLLKEDIDLFITLPPHLLVAKSRYARCVLASLLLMIGQHGMAKGRRALLLLDEAGQLGHMQPLEQGLTLLRGAGLRMVFFFQSLGQLKECFREKESVLLDNTEQIYFGVQSLETAKRVSEMLGNYTETAQSYTGGTSHSHNVGKFGENSGGSVNTSENVSTASHSRCLLYPDEVMRVTSGLGMICFLKGLPPIICRRVLYFSDPLFRRYSRLRQIAKRLTVSLLAVALFVVLFSVLPNQKGSVQQWQPHKSSGPVPPNHSPNWPQKSQHRSWPPAKQ